MMRTANQTVPEIATSIGMQGLLEDLIQRAIRECKEVVSLAVSDHQGLPILDATQGGVPVMTFTAMATMSLRTARTAAEAVGLEPPEFLTVHSPSGELVIMDIPDANASLIAMLRAPANLGLALVVLRKLRAQLGGILQD